MRLCEPKRTGELKVSRVVLTKFNRMPYKQVVVKPEVFLKHKGVTVYHTYEDGDIESPMQNFFCLHPDHADWGGNSDQFDARDLSTYVPTHPEKFLTGDGLTQANKKAWQKWDKQGGWNKDLRDALIKAIDLKIITRDGVFDAKPEISEDQHTALPWVFEDQYIRARALDNSDFGNIVMDPDLSGYNARESKELPNAVKILNAKLTVRAVNNHQKLIDAGKALLKNIHASNKEQYAIALADAITNAERD